MSQRTDDSMHRVRRRVATIVTTTLLAALIALPLGASPAGAAASAAQTIVSAGNGFSCALYAGSAQCWGGGALGDYSNFRTTRGPVQGLDSGVAGIAGGFMTGCALTTAGGVKCWGDNRSGAVGDGTTVDRETPVDVVGLGSGVTQVDTDGYHSCAVTTAGAVLCWGWDQLTPTVVPTLGSGMASVAVGQQSACAVSTAGKGYCWGSNWSWQLGDGTRIDHPTPIAVPGLSSGVASISVGSSHASAAMTNGTVKCWGGSVASPGLTPTTVPISGVTSVAAGTDSSSAVTGAGQVLCWGRQLMLGDGSTADRSTPGVVPGVTGATGVAVGVNQVCANGPTGVRCWGSNGNGELGDGTRTTSRTPVSVIYRPAEIVPRGAEVAEADTSQTSTLLVRVELSVASAVPVTVDWTTTPVPPQPFEATAGVDYVATSGTLSFAPGERVALVPVTVLGDDFDENDEYVRLTFSNPVGAPLTTDLAGAYGIIRDDEPTPTVVPSGGFVVEGDAGTKVVQVPVTLSGPSASTVTVQWTTLDVAGAPAGVASSGSDFQAASGTVTFAPGQTTAVIGVTVNGDTTVEDLEYVVVSFNFPVNAKMGGFWGLGFGLIQNDD